MVNQTLHNLKALFLQINNNFQFPFFQSKYFLESDDAAKRTLLFLTDAAASMILLGKLIKNEPNFQQMLHFLCVAHGMNNVASVVKKHYNTLDKVIMGVKKIFKKSHARIQIFREQAPGILLPPSPCVTRWGKWIECSKYYDDEKNRQGLVRAFKKMQEKEKKNPKILEQMISLLESQQMKDQANFVHTRFYKICEFIANIESDQFETQMFFQELRELLSCVNAEGVPAAVKEHFNTIFERNDGYMEITKYFTCMLYAYCNLRIYLIIFCCLITF